MATIGNLYEHAGDVNFEWKIKDVLSLSNDKMDVCYESMHFYCFGASWKLRIYPNGEKGHGTDGWIGLYLIRTSNGFPVTVHFTMGLKDNNGKIGRYVTYKSILFEGNNNGLGKPALISRSELAERKSTLTPSDILTVICYLKNTEAKCVTGSLFHRYQEISSNLRKIYLEAKKMDFRIKIEGRDILAHRVILETRSLVFDAMLRHNMNESQTSEVTIEDVDFRTMNDLLLYMYSGDIDVVTRDNALPLYAAAEKYDVKDVKEICLEFIKRNLSVDWVCDVITFAELYQDNAMVDYCREYFKQNADKIIETDKWKIFSKENHDTSTELYNIVVKTLFKK